MLHLWVENNSGILETFSNEQVNTCMALHVDHFPKEKIDTRTSDINKKAEISALLLVCSIHMSQKLIFYLTYVSLHLYFALT